MTRGEASVALVDSAVQSKCAQTTWLENGPITARLQQLQLKQHNPKVYVTKPVMGTVQLLWFKSSLSGCKTIVITGISPIYTDTLFFASKLIY